MKNLQKSAISPEIHPLQNAFKVNQNERGGTKHLNKTTAVIKLLLAAMILLLLLVAYIGYRYFTSAHQNQAFIKPSVSTETVLSTSNQPVAAKSSDQAANKTKSPSRSKSKSKSPTATNTNAAKPNNSLNQNKSKNPATSSSNQPTSKKKSPPKQSKPLTGQAIQGLQKKKQPDKQVATQKEDSNTNIDQPAAPKDYVVPTIGITTPTAPTAPLIEAPKP
jgi:outer membrane biosynthesis protein TonB